MKKKLFFGAFFVAIAMVGAVVGSKSFGISSTEDNLLMENVEALTDGENGVGAGNTGPGKLKKCAGRAGYRKFCMCENSNACTPEDCH